MSAPSLPSSWRKVINLTNLTTLLFVGYMGWALQNLYSVAVPKVPSIFRPDGSSKPLLKSYWLQAPSVDFEMVLSTSPQRDPYGEDGREIVLLRKEGVAFSWDLGFEAEVELDLETGPHAGLSARCSKVELSPSCSAAAAAWARLQNSTAASSAGGGGASSPSLEIGRWANGAAQKIVRAVRRGRPVYLHASAVWTGASVFPPQGVHPDRRGDFSPLKSAMATTNLVQQARYIPPRPVRYLLEDPFGHLLRARVAAADNTTGGIARARKTQARGGSEEDAGGAAAGGEDAYAIPVKDEEWPHWVGQASIGVIMDTQPYPRDEVPPQIDAFLRKDPQRSVYVPIMAVNAVRPTRERFHPLNRTLTSLPLRIRVSPTAIGQWQLMSMLDASLTAQQSLGATDKDTDDVIRLIAETPLWLLGITFVVSFIHLLFDGLAFKNDVLFWQATKTLRGISVRSLTITFVSNVIITLFLYEEGSSLLVLIPQAANTFLLVWKILKGCGIVWSLRFGVLPWPRYDKALHATATEGVTSAADSEAVSYLTILLLPVVIGFATYALVYQQFVSWWDYSLTTGVSAVYTFGFILMCPQLWINYKLKSVAALPWRVLMYRFGNTIIDDLFASIIKMPMMHRVSVFRDDLVFVVYMLQRRWYPVDLSRPAEGFADDDDTRAAAVPSKSAAGSGKQEPLPLEKKVQ